MDTFPDSQCRRFRPISLSIILTIAVVLAVTSCRTLPTPIVPPEDVPEDPVDAYKSYRLYTVGPKISFHVLQGYQEINPTYVMLEPLFRSSSMEAWTAFEKSRRRGQTGMILSGVGGALMGASIGYDIGSGFQGGTPVVIAFSAGAAASIIGIILVGSNTGPFMDSLEAYNRDLIERWNLNIDEVPAP